MRGSMNIRPAQHADALAIATAQVRAWQDAYSHLLPASFLAGLSVPDRASRWERIIEVAESSTDVADVDGQAVAFASYGHCRDDHAPANRGEIWAIYASPAVWGQGAGRALLNASLAALWVTYSEVSLWVLANNPRGRRFYEANGFAPVPASEKRFELGGVEVEELLYIRRNAS